MMGKIFSKYLYDSFALLLCTPLSTYLFQYIIEIWNQQNPVIMKDMNLEEKKNMIKLIYDKDPYKYINLMKCNDDNEKEKIQEFVENIRKDIKFLDQKELKINKYDEDTYKLIIEKIIKVKIKSKFDLFEKDMINLEKKLKKSSIPQELVIIFEKYFDRILEDMIDLENFIDSEKVVFIKNYYDLIYDINQDKLTINEIKFVVQKKITEFQQNLKKEEFEITLMYNTYINILTKWINIYNEGNNIYKVYNYPDMSSFEEVSIYEDICSHGERYLIKLISPIINEMPSDQKNKIILKMSSGTKFRCEKYFINEYELTQKMLNLSSDEKFMKKIRINISNKKEFEHQIKNIADEIHNLMTLKK